MNKTKIIQELKGMFNSTKQINGQSVRRQCWENKQWQIVDGLDFSTAKVIQAFYYQEELAKELSK